MKSRKYSKLKRHPIVRFIRGIFRLFRVLFRPKRTIARLELPQPVAIEPASSNNSFNEDRLILDLPRPVAIELPSFDRNFDRSFDTDRLVTVGDVLGSIKWQSPPPAIQKEFTSNSRIFRPQDVSRN